MGVQLCPMELIKMCLRSNSSARHLLRSLYLHLHQACLRGRHLHRLDMVVPKAFFLQVSILLSSKASPHQVLHPLQVLVLHLGLDHRLGKSLHPECRRDFNSQGLEGLGSKNCSEGYFSSNERNSCRYDIQGQKKPVFSMNEVSEYVPMGQHVQ